MFAYLAISRLKIDLFHIRDSIWSLIWPSTVRSCSFKVLQVLFLCFPSLDPSLTLSFCHELSWNGIRTLWGLLFNSFRLELYCVPVSVSFLPLLPYQKPNSTQAPAEDAAPASALIFICCYDFIFLNFVELDSFLPSALSSLSHLKRRRPTLSLSLLSTRYWY